jgi:hypothetical protein
MEMCEIYCLEKKQNGWGAVCGFCCMSLVVGGAWRESLDGLAAPSHSSPWPATFNHD